MLGPNLTSFLFKMLHNILPTSDRVSRILPNQSPLCTRCTDNGENIETLQHALFDCVTSSETSQPLVDGLKLIIPSITPEKIITLDFECEEHLSFPLTWIIAHFLWSLWGLRTSRKTIKLINIRTDLEASCRLLRESRLNQTMEILKLILPDL